MRLTWVPGGKPPGSRCQHRTRVLVTRTNRAIFTRGAPLPGHASQRVARSRPAIPEGAVRRDLAMRPSDVPSQRLPKETPLGPIVQPRAVLRKHMKTTSTLEPEPGEAVTQARQRHQTRATRTKRLHRRVTPAGCDRLRREKEMATRPASNREAMSRTSRSATGKPATSHSARLEQVLFVRHVDAHASKLACTKTSQ
jgi:hypothetical protein